MATTRCEHCGSKKININTSIDSSYSIKKGLLGSLIFGQMGAVMGIGGKKKEIKSYHCQDCGWQSSKPMDNTESFCIDIAISSDNKESCKRYKEKYKNIEWTDTTYQTGNSYIGVKSSSSGPILTKEMLKNTDGLTEYVVPDGIVEIGDHAFSDYQNNQIRDTLETVIIPSSVVKIGNYAFSGCKNLKNVIFSDGLKEIGEWAFAECYNLVYVQLPNTLFKIADYAFHSTGIKNIIIPSSVKCLGEGVFCSTNLEHFEIPQSVIQIGDTCVAWCAHLKTYKLHPAITCINFYRCNQLEAIDIPEGIEVINGLHNQYETLTLPSTVKKIGRNAFVLCSKLKKLTITSEIDHFGRWTVPSKKDLEIVFTKMKTWEDEDGTVIDLTNPEEIKAMLRQTRDWNRKK